MVVWSKVQIGFTFLVPALSAKGRLTGVYVCLEHFWFQNVFLIAGYISKFCFEKCISCALKLSVNYCFVVLSVH